MVEMIALLLVPLVAFLIVYKLLGLLGLTERLEHLTGFDIPHPYDQ